MPSKKQLEQDLADAKQQITALERELENRAQGREDDIIPDTEWSLLRATLEGRVGLDADHMELVQEAASVVRAWDNLPDGIVDVYDQVAAYCPDLDNSDDITARVCEAFELREDWISHGLDQLEPSLWRAGLLRDGRTMFEALESLTF